MKTKLFAAASAASLLAACATPTEPAFDRARSDAALDAMGIDANDAVLTGSNYRFAFEDFSEEGNEFGPDAAIIIGRPDLSETGGYLFSQLALENLVTTAEGEQVQLGRAAIVGPNEALSDFIIRSAMSGEEDWDSFAEGWTDYRFSAIEMEAIAVADETDDSFDHIGIGRIALTGFDDDRTGRFEMLGLDMDVSDPDLPLTMRLGEFSFDGLPLHLMDGFIVALMEGETDEDALMEAYFDGFAEMPPVMEGAVAVRDFALVSNAFSMGLDYMTADTVRDGDLYVSTSDMGLFTFEPNPDDADGAEIAGLLGMMGYSALSMTAGGASYYDAAQDRMWTEGENYLEVPDAFRISFDMDIGGWSEYHAAAMSMGMDMDETMSDDEAFAMMRDMYGAIILHEFSITITDLSLLERGLAFAAEQQGSTAEQLRAQAGMMVAMGAMAAPPELPRDVLTDGSEALTQFIAEGGSLTISMTPDAPVSVGALLDQAETGAFDFNALGFGFSHTAPQ